MADKNEKLHSITEQLERGVQALFESDRYKAYLQTMAKFYHYSANNCLLIHLQRPDATYVASYTTWKRLGRQVNKGEKGIAILCPITLKKKLAQEESTLDVGETPDEAYTIIPAYKVGYTFDISQTSGKELPTIADELRGDMPKYREFFQAITSASPVPIEFEDITSGAKGYFHILENRIAIQRGLSEQQTIKTAIHEIAHAMLDNAQSAKQAKYPADKRTREVRAESIAFCVCSHFGIDTSNYSFGYVAAWSASRKLEELHENLNVIHETSRTIISDINRALGRENNVIFRQKMQPLQPCIAPPRVHKHRAR